MSSSLEMWIFIALCRVGVTFVFVLGWIGESELSNEFETYGDRNGDDVKFFLSGLLRLFDNHVVVRQQ